jgi:hypothetical protein
MGQHTEGQRVNDVTTVGHSVCYGCPALMCALGDNELQPNHQQEWGLAMAGGPSFFHWLRMPLPTGARDL